MSKLLAVFTALGASDAKTTNEKDFAVLEAGADTAVLDAIAEGLKTQGFNVKIVDGDDSFKLLRSDITIPDSVDADQSALLTTVGERLSLDLAELAKDGDTSSSDSYLALFDGYDKLGKSADEATILIARGTAAGYDDDADTGTLQLALRAKIAFDLPADQVTQVDGVTGTPDMAPKTTDPTADVTLAQDASTPVSTGGFTTGSGTAGPLNDYAETTVDDTSDKDPSTPAVAPVDNGGSTTATEAPGLADTSSPEAAPPVETTLGTTESVADRTTVAPGANATDAAQADQIATDAGPTDQPSDTKPGQVGVDGPTFKPLDGPEQPLTGEQRQDAIDTVAAAMPDTGQGISADSTAAHVPPGTSAGGLSTTETRSGLSQAEAMGEASAEAPAAVEGETAKMGEMVVYVSTNGDQVFNGVNQYPAVVTKVNDDGTVDVTAFPPLAMPFYEIGVPHVGSEPLVRGWKPL